MILALIISGVFAIMQMRSIGAKAEELFSENLTTETKTGILRRDMLLMREKILEYPLAPAERRAEVATRMRELETEIADDLTALRAQQGLTTSQVTLLETTEAKLADWYRARDGGPVAKTDAGDRDGAANAALYGVGGQAFTDAFAAVGKFAAETRGVAEAANQAAQDTQSTATTLMIGLIVVATVIGAGVAFWIARGITGPLTAVGRVASDLAQRVIPGLAAVTEAVAAGDLTQEASVDVDTVTVSTQDEIGDMAGQFNTMIEQLNSMGQSVNTMVGSLRDLIGQVGETGASLNEASSQLSAASEQAGQATQGIASTVQQVAEGANDQSERVQQTTETMQQLSQAIDQIAAGSREQATNVEQAADIVSQVSSAIGEVARNAQAASDGATQANDAAQNGEGMVRQTVDGMDKIRAAVDSVSGTVTDLGTQSAEIGKIVAVIDDIAAQTNLLALNAAIEAARAGEQGRGFAVVADEVRKLAERVTEATKEIATLIETVQRGVDQSIKATEEGTKEVASGTQLANEAGEALTQILAAVSTVSGQVEQISAAAEEVSASSDEMVKTIDGVSQVVEQNSSATEQMAASSTEVDRAMEGIASVTAQNSASTQEVSSAAEEMSAQVEEVVGSAQALAEMAQELQTSVSSFQVDSAQGAVVQEVRQALPPGSNSAAGRNTALTRR